MTVKQVLKKYKDILIFTDTKELRIIDIPNHWELLIEINALMPKPLNKYFKKLLRRKVEYIYWEVDMLTLEIY